MSDADHLRDGGEYEKVLRKTRKPCSCYMCGNFRKRYGVTYQEELADLDMNQQLADS